MLQVEYFLLLYHQILYNGISICTLSESVDLKALLIILCVALKRVAFVLTICMNVAYFRANIWTSFYHAYAY